jgi:hypothetical protein
VTKEVFQMKNKKVLIIALAAAGLVIASIGGVALARAGAVNNNPGKAAADVSANATKPFLARVAEILGVDQTKLEAAVKQAKEEQQLQLLKNKLQKLVEAGKITQAQADSYLNWVQSKPDLAPYQEQLKNWMQNRPQLPQEFKDWQQGRPDVPFPNVGPRMPRLKRIAPFRGMGMGGAVNMPALNLAGTN